MSGLGLGRYPGAFSERIERFSHLVGHLRVGEISDQLQPHRQRIVPTLFLYGETELYSDLQQLILEDVSC
jgi:hypothetical protein